MIISDLHKSAFKEDTTGKLACTECGHAPEDHPFADSNDPEDEWYCTGKESHEGKTYHCSCGYRTGRF